MRRSPYKFAAVSAALSIACFCSCERHHPDELPQEAEYVKSDAAKKEAPHDKAHDKAISDQQQMSTTALTPTPSPSPAQFFPSPTP